MSAVPSDDVDALKNFESKINDIGDFYDVTLDDDMDKLHESRPWMDDDKYFKRVIITRYVLSDLLSHAVSGGSIEIMGLVQGRIRGDSILISECFRLPVEGTETRVNAGADANEYMIEYTELNERTNFSKDPVCGWYHSHPGYGCWLSGIDVSTQRLYQTHQDPFVALVIDPVKSVETGQIEIGAFRTFPVGSKGHLTASKVAVPSEKSSDFGAHADQYYQLDIEVYDSPSDLLISQALLRQSWPEHLAKVGGSENLSRIADELADSASSVSEAVTDKERFQMCKCVHNCAGDLIQAAIGKSIVREVFRPFKSRPSDTDTGVS